MDIFHVITEDLSLGRASGDLEIFFLLSLLEVWHKAAKHNGPLGCEYV